MCVAAAAHVCPQRRGRPRHARPAQRGQEGCGRGLALRIDAVVLGGDGEVKVRSQRGHHERVAAAVGDRRDQRVGVLASHGGDGLGRAVEEQPARRGVPLGEPQVKELLGIIAVTARRAVALVEPALDREDAGLAVRRLVGAGTRGAQPRLQVLGISTNGSGQGDVGRADHRTGGPERIVEVEGDESQRGERGGGWRGQCEDDRETHGFRQLGALLSTPRQESSNQAGVPCTSPPTWRERTSTAPSWSGCVALGALRSSPLRTHRRAGAGDRPVAATRSGLGRRRLTSTAPLWCRATRADTVSALAVARPAWSRATTNRSSAASSAIATPHRREVSLRVAVAASRGGRRLAVTRKASASRARTARARTSSRAATAGTASARVGGGSIS